MAARTQSATRSISAAGAATAVARAKPSHGHVIGSFVGDKDGPTLVAIGSLHGNEPAGSQALAKVADALEHLSGEINGRVYLLRGNTRALDESLRFIDQDLNRHWKTDTLAHGSGLVFPTTEDLELRELDEILDRILVTARDEVYVIDLHSTSADGMPFATVGDTMRNRKFALKFPVTILLGIEEQLDGTMLEYLNNAGAVTLGFEGGQHESGRTVANHEALTWLALVNAGILHEHQVPGMNRHQKALANGQFSQLIFEVLHRHKVREEDEFRMNPGFNNFDPVRQGDVIAEDAHGAVKAEKSGLILMPLYQRLGEDGYFIGRRVARFWLWLSGVLRNLGVPNLVHLLPGVKADPDRPETIIVNTHVARFFPLQVFHLLGFRKRRWREGKLVVSRRKYDTISPFIRVS